MAKEGRGQISGHGAAGNTNKRPLQPLDNSDDDNTHKPLSQPNSSNSPKKDTDGAESGSKEKVEGTGCTHYKTVWGLRLDILLLTIVLGIAAVVFKTPLGKQLVVIGNPDIQKQLVYVHEGFYEVKNQLKHLKSEVNKNSNENMEQSSKLLTIHYDIMKINDILSPTDRDGILYPDIKTQANAIIEHIAYIKSNHDDLKREVDSIQRVVVDVKAKQELSDSNWSKDITRIIEAVTDTHSANSDLSFYVSHIEKYLKILESNLDTTTSKVEALNKEMQKPNDMVSEVRENAKIAAQMVGRANAKLKIVEQHLFNKDALTTAILILFFLIIGLMLYVLKLKSSLELALAGGSTYQPLKVSREMEVVLQKIPIRPTLDNALCIVSFDASYSDEYKQIINETLGQFGGISLRTHVIRKHADTTELPNCRMYIMCVEFTKRHVIIEEQGLGLGDLNLTLYRGVRKLGGALMILYIHDPGSRNLTDDQLYSDGIYCVKKQPELKELCDKDRFISAHKKLNKAQKKALETAISNVLNIQTAMY